MVSDAQNMLFEFHLGYNPGHNYLEVNSIECHETFFQAGAHRIVLLG